ncbi:DUF6978 family protein [Pseudomonas sp. LB3P93]
MTLLSDALIAQLLTMDKVVKNSGAKPTLFKKSLRFNYTVQSSDDKHSFELYMRQNQMDPNAFSCGLTYYPSPGDKGITLTRYNGGYHVHRNPLEGDEEIRNLCHIHLATERYMELGKGDKFAETTTRYNDLSGALTCLLSDCNITGLELDSKADDHSLQIPLFE